MRSHSCDTILILPTFYIKKCGLTTKGKNKTELQEWGRKEKNSILVAACKAEAFIHSFKSVSVRKSHHILEVVLKPNSLILIILYLFWVSCKPQEVFNQRRDIIWLAFGGRWWKGGRAVLYWGKTPLEGRVCQVILFSLWKFLWFGYPQYSENLRWSVLTQVYFHFLSWALSSLLVGKAISLVLGNCLELFFDDLLSFRFLFSFFLECSLFGYWTS